MATADRLVERMYSWMERRRECAQKLRDLAGELESLRKKCNAGETVGNSIAVVGAGCMIGAGLLTFATGGIAAPFLGALGAAYSTVGATITVTTMIIEGFQSSGTMKKAKAADSSANSIAKEINELFEKLKTESLCERNPAQHTTKEVLKALARRSGLGESDLDLDLLLNKSLFSDKPGYIVISELEFEKAMKNGIVGIFSVFAFAIEHKALTKLLSKGTEKIMMKMAVSGFKPVLYTSARESVQKSAQISAQKLVKTMAAKGLKPALKAGTRVAGGVLGLAFSLPDAINNWETLIKNNHVTEASQSLRDTAKAILVVVDDLEENLKSICNEFEELKEVKDCIENRMKRNRRGLVEYAKKICKDPEVKAWLEKEARSEVFLRLVDIFQMVKTEMDKKKTEKREIDITFVAHGGIPESMIPASLFTPLPTILDVLLYSPWNCTIDAKVAYGIAAGTIKPKHRTYHCKEKKCPLCPNPHNHEPSNVPGSWNSMRASKGQSIPNIKVQSMVAPKDGAWAQFVYLKNRWGLPDYDRVVIPFILPENIVVEVPFVVVTLALALVLLFSKMRARVHLAACLSKVSRYTNLNIAYLSHQYACAYDHTHMSASDDVFSVNVNFELFQNIKAMFG